MSKFGLVVEYTVLLDAPSEESARKRCKDLWCERYPAEPFNDNIARLFLTTLSERSEEDELPKSGLYDELEAIIARQSTFYYQVSGMPRFSLSLVPFSFIQKLTNSLCQRDRITRN